MFMYAYGEGEGNRRGGHLLHNLHDIERGMAYGQKRGMHLTLASEEFCMPYNTDY